MAKAVSTFEINFTGLNEQEYPPPADSKMHIGGPGTALPGPGTTFYDAGGFTESTNIHTETPNKMNPSQKPGHGSDWVTGLLLLCLVLLAVIRFHYRKKLAQLFQAFFALNYANILGREGGLFKERYFMPGITVSLLSMSLFVFQAFNYFELNILPSENEIVRYLIIFATLLGLWLLKASMVTISGFIFDTLETSRDYNYNMHIFFIVNGILLLPLVIVTSYWPSGLFFIAGIILLSLIFLFWLFRAFTVGMREKVFSGFHLFLYICSFELLPVIIIAKFVITLLN